MKPTQAEVVGYFDRSKAADLDDFQGCTFKKYAGDDGKLDKFQALGAI